MKMNRTGRAAALLLCALLFTGCGTAGRTQETASSETASDGASSSTAQTTAAAGMDFTFSDRDQDPSYSGAVSIQFTGSGAEIKGSGASFADGVLTLSAAGTYLLSGTLEDGRIVVNAGDSDKLQLVLDSVSVHSGDGPAIWIQNADKVFLTLPEGSQSELSDGAEYALSEEDSNVDAVVFSKADLAVNGSGALNITGSYQHGIVSKDDLIVTGGALSITAAGQAMNGKDCVKISDGGFTLVSGGDAIQSDNTEDTGRGFVYIAGGSFDITAGTDGIQAETVLRIEGGTFSAVTGGGSENASTESAGTGGWGSWGAASASGDTASAKGLKAGTLLEITGGSFRLDTSDDSLHSNGDLTISGGTLELSSGDDGMHADSALLLSGGQAVITKSYEGIEGQTVTITGGEFDVTARDDGVNAAGGNDGSSLNGRPGQNSFSGGADCFIRISGGSLNVDAGGDGLDSNGAFYLEGGEVTVSGPTDGANGALDYNGEGIVTGGALAAVGSAGMAMGFSDTSSQCSLLWNLGARVSAGTALTLTDKEGNTIVSFTPAKEWQSVVITAPALAQGETYTLTAGTETAEITLSSVVTSNGGTGGMSGRGGMPDGRCGGRSGGTPPDGDLPSGEPGGLPEGGGGPAGGEPPEDGSRPERGTPPELPEESASAG